MNETETVDMTRGTNVANKLAAEFNHIEAADGGSMFFELRNESLTAATFANVTDAAAEHGFRVKNITDDGRTIEFKRITAGEVA